MVETQKLRWLPTRLWLARLWLGTFIFLIMATAGCVHSQAPDQEDTKGARSATTSPGTSEQTPTVIFPRHDAPLGSDRGGEYFAGRLALKEGCLRVETPSNDGTNGQLSWLLIWLVGFTFTIEPGTVRVQDELGNAVAHVGDYVRLSRATLTFQAATERMLVSGLSEQCADPYFLVGDEVTAFDPKKEATELWLADPDVVFFREKTEITRRRPLLTAAGVGELILEGRCLRLKNSPTRVHWPTIIWPAGFTPHFHQGVVQIRNGAGRVIAEVGDEIAGGGGFFDRSSGECSGPIWRAKKMKT